jgi:predicted lactoylglutathione lyase
MDTMTSIVIALVVLMMMHSPKKTEGFAKKKKDKVEFKKKDKVIYTDSDDDEVKATIKKVNEDGTYNIELDEDEEMVNNVKADDLKLDGNFFSMITDSFSTCLGVWITAGVLFVLFIIALFM